MRRAKTPMMRWLSHFVTSTRAVVLKQASTNIKLVWVDSRKWPMDSRAETTPTLSASTIPIKSRASTAETVTAVTWVCSDIKLMKILVLRAPIAKSSLARNRHLYRQVTRSWLLARSIQRKIQPRYGSQTWPYRFQLIMKSLRAIGEMPKVKHHFEKYCKLIWNYIDSSYEIWIKGKAYKLSVMIK